jgi:hypothetical protein
MVKSHYKKLKNLYKILTHNMPLYLEALDTNNKDMIYSYEHDFFYGKLHSISIDTGVCSVKAATMSKPTIEHIFAPQGFARHIITNLDTEDKFIELTYPLCYTAKTTSQENKILSMQQNIPILEKYEQAGIKVYAIDVYDEILGLPQSVKDLLPKELIEVDKLQLT